MDFDIREPAIAYGKKSLTPKEYLSFEKTSAQKHEYYQGEIFAMAGASKLHNLIFKNLYINLGIKLKGKPCQPYGSDLRIRIPQNTLYTYPDISILGGDILSHEGEENINEPIILIEILSVSTQNYDRGVNSNYTGIFLHLKSNYGRF